MMKLFAAYYCTIVLSSWSWCCRAFFLTPATSRTAEAFLLPFSFTARSATRSLPRSHSLCLPKSGAAVCLSSSSAPSDVEPPPQQQQQENNAWSGSSVNRSYIEQTRDDLIRIASSLVSKSPTGIFLTLPSDRSEFLRGVARLEALADPIRTTDAARMETDCIGDWTLVATCRKDPLLDPLLQAAAGGDVDASRNDSKPRSSLLTSLPRLDPKLRKSLRVTQRIRSSSSTSGKEMEWSRSNENRNDKVHDKIDRIDNVIEFDNVQTKILPDFLNPLQIDKSKWVLIHKARVESSVPFRIRLALQSIVLNLAGQSQNLDPMGKDVLGLNVNLPFLNEWMVNSGTFDTTFVDGEVRVSRGTVGFLEETRVFVRQGGVLDQSITNVTRGEVEEGEGKDDSAKSSQMGNIVAAVEEVADAVGNLTKSVKTAVERDMGYMREDMETSLEDVKNVVQEDFKGVQKAVEKVKSAVIGDETVEGAVDDAVEAVTKLGQDVEETVRDSSESLKESVEEDVKSIQNAIQNLEDATVSSDLKKEEMEDEETIESKEDTEGKNIRSKDPDEEF